MDNKTKPTPKKPRWPGVLITVCVVVGVLALLVTQLPRGAFSTDLSGIGQGTPALVVARDKNYLAGGEVMDLINTVRSDYEGRIAFLAAHLGHPDGQAFARRHGMEDAVVVVFDADGSPAARLVIPQTAEELRAALDIVDTP
ncbi:hypothetical protein [Thiocapsa rosea]|uniref:DUF4174 domain-containing protein n=1 Tax=Thiocapsa rosea TaxID=69360 RepID=A0A495V3J1_9GAMM|nr:hypothetical protein [Thiocapsa rosea]RKT42937.1 hypothetical protein BDD21_0239 [Thiocapsa rosea]